MPAKGVVRAYNEQGEILDRHRYGSTNHRLSIMKMWETEYDWNVAYVQVSPSLIDLNLTRVYSLDNPETI